ncbi:MAG: hypothetical protein JRI25_08605 [Deltaproteobacteria bacterium]|nr:hypothetical protein [Deltaproteobacteria bacterium]
MRTRRLFRDAWPLIAAALALSACKRNDASLVELDVIEPGDECASGGYLLTTGIDEDDDGSLDADEVSSSEVVCNGEEGTAGSLVRTTPLDPGDPNCPFGGVMVEAGQDDGDEAGTAGDGVLQDGEVDTTEYVCDGEPAFYGESMEPPPAVLGQPTYTIDASGGQGTTADGGDGGTFEINVDDGTIGGGIRIFATGGADASFTFPTVSGYLGSNPLVVSGPVTIEVVDPGDVAGLSNGVIYTIQRPGEGGDMPQLHRKTDTAGDDEDITGIRVEASATLTLPYNDQHNGGVALFVDNDFHLAGTLTTEKNDGEHYDLRLWVDTFVGESTGLVDLSGDAATGADGWDGADLDIDAHDWDWNTEHEFGSVFNQAEIDLSGGNGDNGGDGGRLYFNTETGIVNTATILARGGTGSTDSGGEGGDIVWFSSKGRVWNSGDLDASSGNGALRGGSSYPRRGVEFEVYLGPVLNSGNLSANGGDVTGTCSETCDGGEGGRIDIYPYAGSAITTGTLSARGGSATGTGGTTYGGDGGFIRFNGETEDGWYADDIPPGDFLIAGNMDLSGGDGDYGGDGGRIYMDYDFDDVANSQQIRLLSYTDIYLNGGLGAGDGGDGDSFELYIDEASDSAFVYYGPGGSIVNYANVHLQGGDGTAGDGGDGGSFEIYTDDEYGYVAPWEVVINAGNVDLTGGDGGDSGGEGGWARVFGYSGVENTGSFLADAGAGTDDSGGDASDNEGIFFVSDYGPVVNTAELSAKGGASTNADGGYGGIIELVAWEVHNSGALYASGGSGSMSEGYLGGDGGVAFLHSIWSVTSNTTSTIDVGAGTGHTGGDPGEVFIDAVNVTEDWD